MEKSEGRARRGDDLPGTSKGRAANRTKIFQKELDSIFEKFDPDQSGFVSIKKLKLVMRALGFDCRAAEIDRLTALMMENEAARSVNEDAFSAEELGYVLKDRLATDEAGSGEVSGAFKLFDSDSKGYISVEDLKRVAAELGEVLKDEELQEMIDEADSSKKGRVSETDFTTVMKKTSLY